MRPRIAADYRTLLWVMIAPALVALQFARPALVPYLWWVSAYFALACGVIAHNHNHCPTFKGKLQNQIFGNWISIFYGYPTFAWIPTHNLNHHKYVNKAGDATITWRYSNKHNFIIASTYFFVSAYFQGIPTKEFLQRAKEKAPDQYRRYMWQYVIAYGTHLVMAALAVFLHGWKVGLPLYLFTMGFPAVVALWTVMTFNYD